MSSTMEPETEPRFAIYDSYSACRMVSCVLDTGQRQLIERRKHV
jgi:hypothetical protein